MVGSYRSDSNHDAFAQRGSERDPILGIHGS